ncbi:MAG: M2 family metallopeptidase [Oligoflexia bacterium]|nr:M2 family metallopeptidase [Oligoflexia bacterium]
MSLSSIIAILSLVTQLSTLKILKDKNPLIIPNSWTPILEGKVDIADRKKYYVCLSYFKDSQTKEEKLAYLSSPVRFNCANKLEKNFEFIIPKLNNVTFKIVKEENTAEISFINKGKFEQVYIPFLNIPLSLWSKDETFDSEVLASEKVKRRFPGVLVLPQEKSDRKNELMGELTDRYSKGNTKVCHDFNSKCVETMAFECDQCRYGWFSVVGRGCEEGTRKFCGVDRCGHKNEPACQRGFIHKRLKSKNDVCSPESSTAYCKNGLQLMCNSQKVLVCI